MVNISKQEIRFLQHLVTKLERNRHFIGDGFSVGSLCAQFRLGLENPAIHNALIRDIPDSIESHSMRDQLLQLIMDSE